MAGEARNLTENNVRVKIDNVRKVFNTRNGEMVALNGVSLDIHNNEFICVVGPSGCGKSTLLNIIAGLTEPTSGKVYCDGKEVTGTGTERGVVFQQYALFPNMSVEQNILCGIRSGDKAEKRRVLAEKIRMFRLEGLEKKHPAQLSGGQQQRVALARILCSEPEAILLDEPFSALDSYLKWNLEIELADLLATFNGPILWVSHDRDECYRNCRSVCVMEDGRTGEVTPMDEMIRHPGSVSAARLAGCKNFFAAEARDGKVYLPEWNVALPLAGMENTFTTIGIPDNAVTMSENGAMSCTVCRMILGVEENILLLRPEGSVEGAPMLRITVGHESDLQAGAAVRVALDDSKLLLL